MKFSKLDSHDVVEVHGESRMTGIDAATSIPTPLHTAPDHRLDAMDAIDGAEKPVNK